MRVVGLGSKALRALSERNIGPTFVHRPHNGVSVATFAGGSGAVSG